VAWPRRASATPNWCKSEGRRGCTSVLPFYSRTSAGRLESSRQRVLAAGGPGSKTYAGEDVAAMWRCFALSLRTIVN
jgi:hypothetical protein